MHNYSFVWISSVQIFSQVGGDVWLDKMKSNKNDDIVPLCQSCNKDPKLDKEGVCCCLKICYKIYILTLVKEFYKCNDGINLILSDFSSMACSLLIQISLIHSKWFLCVSIIYVVFFRGTASLYKIYMYVSLSVPLSDICLKLLYIILSYSDYSALSIHLVHFIS